MPQCDVSVLVQFPRLPSAGRPETLTRLGVLVLIPRSPSEGRPETPTRLGVLVLISCSLSEGRPETPAQLSEDCDVAEGRSPLLFWTPQRAAAATASLPLLICISLDSRVRGLLRGLRCIILIIYVMLTRSLRQPVQPYSWLW